MKNILSLIVIVFLTTVAVAQDVKKNSYILNGDVIEATLYHDNGAIAQTGFYNQDNKLTGEWVSYDTNGNKTAVAKYNNGEKVGTWYFFTDNNIQEVSYMDARISKVKTWKSDNTTLLGSN